MASSVDAVVGEASNVEALADEDETSCSDTLCSYPTWLTARLCWSQLVYPLSASEHFSELITAMRSEMDASDAETSCGELMCMLRRNMPAALCMPFEERVHALLTCTSPAAVAAAWAEDALARVGPDIGRPEEASQHAPAVFWAGADAITNVLRTSDAQYMLTPVLRLGAVCRALRQDAEAYLSGLEYQVRSRAPAPRTATRCPAR